MPYRRFLSRFAADPEGWERWSPRPEIAPTFSVESGALKITTPADNPGAYGAWRTTLPGVAGQTWYRFSAFCKHHNIAHPLQDVIARLHWLDANNKRLRSPDHVPLRETVDGRTFLFLTTISPPNATSCRIELALHWAQSASVSWDHIELAETQPTKRLVSIGTVYHRPRGMKSAADAVNDFVRVIESANPRKLDLLVLPEGCTVCGTQSKYHEVSEPVPGGPTCRTLGALAKRHDTYVVAGVYERVGPVVYNTAILLDRQGNLAGKYRKTHLPHEEVEAGLTPGNEYPVFDADFGKLGLTVCWDLQFPEPTRAMALKGAEIIALPIWGGSETLARARAIENHIVLVSSTYDMRSFIVNVDGQIVAEAFKDHPLVVGEVDLNQVVFQPWLGDMRTRTFRERRADIRVE
jgi:predicted amidohydrolase